MIGQQQDACAGKAAPPHASSRCSKSHARAQALDTVSGSNPHSCYLPTIGRNLPVAVLAAAGSLLLRGAG